MSFHTAFVSAAVVASLAGCAGYSSGPSATANWNPRAATPQRAR